MSVSTDLESILTLTAGDRATNPEKEPWMSSAVEMAHLLLRKYIPGAAFDGEPFMTHSVGKYKGKEFVACNCFYHTVAFVPAVFDIGKDAVLVFSREEGGMIPWINTSEEDVLPDVSYFEKGFHLPAGTAEQLLEKVRNELAEDDVDIDEESISESPR